MGVTVVDSLMGTGKTSWALQYMNKEAQYPIMYVTPFLKEVARVVDGTKKDAKLKEPAQEGKKMDNLKVMLKAGENIVCTHELFKKINDECLEFIGTHEYILILDEVLDAVSPYRKIQNQDLELLIGADYVKIEDDGRVSWTDKIQDGMHRYSDIEYYAKNKLAFSTDGVNIMLVFNPQIFKAFKEVFILTYMFEGSVMNPYFELAQISYESRQIFHDGINYSLKEKVKSKVYIPEINICKEKFVYREDYMKRTSFSIGWLNRLNHTKTKIARNDLKNYFQNKRHARVESILYTTSVEGRKKLDGKGYKSAFVAWNARAVNDYSETYNLAYCFNCFLNPSLINFFNAYGIHINEDAYATANLLQWIWRSRIPNGQPINIFIPSVRMRDLLSKWIFFNTENMPSSLGQTAS